MTLTKNKSTPKLRFPKFTGEWRKKQLKDICHMQAGKFVSAANIYENHTNDLYPCYGGNGLRGYTSTFTHNGVYSLIGRQGALCGNVNLGTDKFHATEHAVVVTPKEKVSTKWLFYELILLDLNRYATGQAQPGLSVEVLEKVFAFISEDTDEQQKIADFLTSVDKKIEQLSKKKELLEKYKKGFMQKIFSQELRFKDDNENDFPNWQEKKLGDVGDTYTGLAGKTSIDFGSGKPYIQYKQVFDNSKIVVDKFGYVNLTENENQNKVLFGDVFFTTSSETPNEVGFASVLLEPVEELYLNSFCFGFRPKSLEKLNPLFSRYLFRSPVFRKEVVKLAQGSTRYNLSKTELVKTIIEIPNPKEQKKIADFLASIDKKIELVSKEIELAKEFKKGLLQLMFV